MGNATICCSSVDFTFGDTYIVMEFLSLKIVINQV